MNEPDLWLLSINAFAAVVVILSLLAGALRLLTTLFPVTVAPSTKGPSESVPANRSASQVDTAVRAAIETAVQRAYPGSAVLDVREREQGPSS